MVIGRLFLDESFSKEPYVSVGWVSESRRWQGLSKQWVSALRAGKHLEYFKLSEALLLRGAFAGWTQTERDEKLRQLAGVIPHDDHIIQGIACHTRQSDFDTIARVHLRRIYKNPYYFVMAIIMLKAVDWFYNFDRIDFVLDKDNCKQADRMRRIFYSRLQPINPRFGECCTQSDKETMPLQAADMLAG